MALKRAPRTQDDAAHTAAVSINELLLLWTGRKLSAVEQERLKSLSAPLVAFLASCTPGTQASGSKTSGSEVPADRPTKPKGVRR